MHTGGALLAGAMFGIAIYIVNFHLIASLALPRFIMARNPISAFSAGTPFLDRAVQRREFDGPDIIETAPGGAMPAAWCLAYLGVSVAPS